MTKLKRTVRFRWPTANHTPPGTSTFFARGFIRRWNIFTVKSQIEANPALESVPARNATNFAQPLNRGDELCGKHGGFASRKILGIFLFNGLPTVLDD